MKANDVFEQPKGMNTFRHFLGFRNPILCTMKINFKENEVTFGKCSGIIKTWAIFIFRRIQFKSAHDCDQ
jgi:hypothetical protein